MEEITKEESIASYPSSSITTFLFCIVVSVFFLIAAISAAMADHKVMSSIFGVIFILLALGGLVGFSMGREPSRELVSEWKATTYQKYIESLPVVRETITLNKFESDAERVYLKILDDTGEPSDSTMYINYIEVTGLESIGIPDGKVNINMTISENKR